MNYKASGFDENRGIIVVDVLTSMAFLLLASCMNILKIDSSKSESNKKEEDVIQSHKHIQSHL